LIGVCFEKTGCVQVRELPDPEMESPTDAIVRVSLAGLCGSDLHPFLGREAGLEPGTVMGHEFVGEVIATGTEVKNIKVADRVCAPFTTNCGHCYYCEAGLTSRCIKGQLFGWREKGKGLHGGQATLVRVPLADGTLMPIPAGIADETALLLGDNLSTGRFAAEMAGVTKGGSYAVIGCGTVGLLAIAAARELGASGIVAVDPCQPRLEIANALGASTFATPDEAWKAVMHQTNGRGADGIMEMVGLPEAQSLAYAMIRPGGTMSVIGCHCTPHFTFSPADAYDKNLKYLTGRCPARHYMTQLSNQPEFLNRDLSWCVTHRFDLEDGVRAYEVFSQRQDQCIKAVLRMP